MKLFIATIATGLICPALIILMYCYSKQIDSFLFRLFARAVGIGVSFFVAYFSFLFAVVVWVFKSRDVYEH